MRKASVLIITLLCAILCAAVVWQWLVYSNKTSEITPQPDESVLQHVKINMNQGKMHIQQVFSKLKEEQNYNVIIPENAENFSCTTGTGEQCDQTGDPAFVKAKGTQLEFKYTLSVMSSAKEILLNDWLVLLKGQEWMTTKIEIVDRLHPKGTWVAGIPLKGFKQKELVSYFVFEGQGPNPSLYWQNSNLVIFSEQRGISYYGGSKRNIETYKFNHLEAFTEKHHLAVVLRNKGHTVRGSGLVLIDGTTEKDELEKQLAISFLSLQFPGITASDNWLLDAFASLITKQSAEDSKSILMIREMQNKLSAEEVNQLIRYIADSNSTLDHESLDEQLARMKGMKTRFFTLNKANDSSTYPLIFIDTRNVVAYGRKITNLDIVSDKNKQMFPFLATLKTLGYETAENKGTTSIKIKNDKLNYTFNLKNSTFTKNGKSYGLLENPFRVINGTIYVEKSWLEAVFGISIVENEEEIVLSL